MRFKHHVLPVGLSIAVTCAVALVPHLSADEPNAAGETPARSADEAPVQATGGDPVAGGVLYVKSCSACHGWSGDGQGRVKIKDVEMPDLRDLLTVESRTAEDTFSIIKDGGEAHGLCEKMLPAGNRLSDQDIRDLTAYVRNLPAYEHVRQTRAK